MLRYLVDPIFQVVNTAGKPATGGYIEVYLHGTRDKYYCASDFDGTLHPFRIPLDSLGSNIILADDDNAYDIYVYNRYGSLLMSRYNVTPLSIDDIAESLAQKKDRQDAVAFNGSATKTVKKISQNANGVMSVEFEDIDFPYNIKINSPDDSIEVGTPVVDPELKEETIPLSVKRPGLVKADSEDTAPGTLIDKLDVVDNIRDPEDPEDAPLLSLGTTVDGQGNRKVAINEDNLQTVLGHINENVFNIMDAIDSMDFDEVPHGSFGSSLNQSPGDGTTTSIQVSIFRPIEAPVGDAVSWTKTTEIGGEDFGTVTLEPGTYIICSDILCQWVGNPRGTYLPQVGNVLGEPFDFSQQQEVHRRMTNVVTVSTTTQFKMRISFDAATPVMGFWINSAQIVKIAGGMIQTNVAHDNTLTGKGSVAEPLGVNTQNVAQATLAGNLAPAFDTTRTSENPYRAGESVVYEGKTYTFKVDHHGARATADVYSSTEKERISCDFIGRTGTSLVAKGFYEKSFNSGVYEAIAPFYKGRYECTVSSEVIVLVDIYFYNGNEQVYAVPRVTVSTAGGAKKIYFDLPSDCNRVRIARTTSPSSSSLLTTVNLVPQATIKNAVDESAKTFNEVYGKFSFKTISAANVDTYLPKGSVTYNISAVTSSTTVRVIFKDIENNDIYDSDNISIAANTAYAKTVYINEDIYRISVATSVPIEREFEFTSDGCIEDKIKKLDENVGSLVGGVTFHDKSGTTIETVIPKGDITITVKNQASAAWRTIKLYDKDDNLIYNSGSTLINANVTKTFTASVAVDVYKIVASTVNIVDCDISVESSGNIKLIGEKVEKDVFDELEVDLPNTTSMTLQKKFLAGYIKFEFGTGANPAFVSADLKDIDGNIVGVLPDRPMIEASEGRIDCVYVSKDVYSIVIHNTNSTTRHLKITSSGSIAGGLNKIKNSIEPGFAVTLPSVVYLRTNQEFSIWYYGIIKGFQAFNNGSYSIRVQKKNSDGTYSAIGAGTSTHDKWAYISSSETEFDIEIRIINTYTELVEFSKVIHIVVKDPSSVVTTSPKICLIGDSFTDGHRVAEYVWRFLEDDGLTPMSIGVNSSGYGTYKDDAWAGYGIGWFYDSYYGYHRADRPATDDVVIGGVTYTRNEFVEGSGNTFDFSYYMTHYHPGVSSIDCVVFNIGINDVVWNPKSPQQLNSLLDKLDAMIDSVHTFEANAKVILCTVTAQPKKDAATSNMGNVWLTAEVAKARQERWNDLLINHFDNDTYKNAGVFIAPTAANIDTENAFYMTDRQVDKYDSSITERVTTDIHPDVIGAKFIADTLVCAIEGVID